MVERHKHVCLYSWHSVVTTINKSYPLCCLFINVWSPIKGMCVSEMNRIWRTVNRTLGDKDLSGHHPNSSGPHWHQTACLWAWMSWPRCSLLGNPRQHNRLGSKNDPPNSLLLVPGFLWTLCESRSFFLFYSELCKNIDNSVSSSIHCELCKDAANSVSSILSCELCRDAANSGAATSQQILSSPKGIAEITWDSSTDSPIPPPLERLCLPATQISKFA